MDRLNEWQGASVEFAVSEAIFFTFAVGFDQADFIRETLHGIFERGSDG
jgi:hypothetical protein